MNADQDKAVIDLLQAVEHVQRNQGQARRKLDTEFEDFMAASIKDRAELRKMLGEVSKDLKNNTQITEQIADVLASFRVISAVAKWVTIVGGACVYVWHVITGAPR